MFKRGTKRQLRGFRLRELEDRDSTYIAPMAQFKSEILSQGFPSLQISRPSKVIPDRLEQPSSLSISSNKWLWNIAAWGFLIRIQFKSGYFRGNALCLCWRMARGTRLSWSDLSLTRRALHCFEVGIFQRLLCSLCCKGFGHAALRCAGGVVVV